MAIWPSHFAWARERSEKHSGAQRRYGERTFSLPRDRTASQAPCSLCDRIATTNQLAGPSLHPRISPEVSARLCPPLAVELTPLSAEARKIHPRCSASRCSVEDLQVSSSRCRRVSSRILISRLFQTKCFLNTLFTTEFPLHAIENRILQEANTTN